MIKSPDYSYKEPGFGAQHPHGDSQPTTVSGVLTLSSGLRGYTHKVHIHISITTYKHEIKIKWKRKTIYKEMSKCKTIQSNVVTKITYLIL